MALQHLRSSTANKRPDPTAMAEGQLALNTANASPGLFYKDATGSLIKSGPVHIGATAPNATPAAGGHAGNSVGEAWLDTSGTNPLLKIYNGASFVTVQPVASGTVVSTADTGTVTSTMILDGTILNADINASAAIVDTKLATIATGGKVSNSATTATNANTASAIVARDASGNFTAGTITAAVTGAASSNVLKAGDTMTGALVVPLASAATPSLTFTGDLNTGIYSPGADQVAVATNGTGRLFVDANGNVGVGPIQSPSWASASSTVLSILDSAFSNVAALRVVGPTTITEVGAGPSFTFAGSFSNHPYQLYTNSIERLRITSAGLVGIGTSTVSRSLHIAQANSTAYSSSDFEQDYQILRLNNTTDDGSVGLEFQVGTNGQAAITADEVTDGNTDICFGTRGSGARTEKVRITAGGLVGIGTTSPQVNLHLKDSTNPRLRFEQNNSSVQQQIESSGGNFVFTADVTNAISGAAGLVFNAGTNERARIDGSGRLLVGTSTSLHHNAQLQTAGTGYYGYNHFQFSNDAFAPTISVKKSRSASVGGNTIVQNDDRLGTFSFFGADGSTYIQGAGIDAFVDGTPGANDMPGRLVFSTTADGASSPTERMRISSVGNLMVGTTTGSVTDGGLFYFSPAATAEPRLLLGHATGTGSGAPYVNFLFNAASIGSITQSGTTAVAYNTTSDYRLKENVTAFTDGIARLHQLKPCRFNFIAESERLVDGFLAHEVQTIVPEAITGEKDEVDADGNPVYQGIDQSKLVPLLTAALQEAIGEIESLKARLTAAGI
jgi:hypothetical protein